MQLETKYLRLRGPVALGSRFDDWSACWLGGWARHRMCYLVMVVKSNPDVPCANLGWRYRTIHVVALPSAAARSRRLAITGRHQHNMHHAETTESRARWESKAPDRQFRQRLSTSILTPRDRESTWPTLRRKAASVRDPRQSQPGLEQVLGQLQQLEKFGLRRQAWKAFQVMVEETRAEVNFELVERLAEIEQRDWTHFGRLRHQREKKYRDPQDVLIEADRLRQQMKKRRARRRGTPQE